MTNLKPINIFNLLKIERTTDILALTAFILSLLALLPKLLILFDYSDVHLYEPEGVIIVNHFFSKSRGNSVRFAIPLTYENKGNSRYSDIIKKEYARMIIPGQNGEHTYDFIWESNVTPKIKEKKPTDLDMNPLGLSKPFKLKGGDIETHMTYFTPCPTERRNYLKWSEFEHLLAKTKQIKFIIGFTTINGKSKSITRNMKVSGSTYKLVKEEKRNWLRYMLYDIKQQKIGQICQ